MTFTFESRSLDDTSRFARCLAEVAELGLVIGLQGDLGAGKTALVRAFLIAWTGDEDAVAPSPTFTLLNRHETPRGRIHHFDVYRLEGFDELEAAGGRDLLFDPEALAFVEWVDRLDEEDFELLRLEIRLDGETRMIEVSAKGKAPERIAAVLKDAL